MFEKLANIFRIPDLRNRVLFTLALLAVYRLGGHIPTPGVNADMLQQFFANNRGSVLGFVSGHHALHHGLHHSPVAHRGL
jgi:preprotein translocase subunit SecY